MELFKLLGTIAIDNARANSSIDETTEKASHSEGTIGKAFTGIGNAAVQVGKMVAAGLAVGVTAVGALAGKALTSYADYEQLIGGVETLYGTEIESIEEYAKSVGKTADKVGHEYEMMINRQDTVMQNAANAYKTAGLSANEYMNTVNGFAASLTSSLGKYGWQAASYADMIVTDMADNANKMGTSMESIQNAYSGFAKQNYTMLDNLKLGYGGTKEEMERLLTDAEKYAGYIEGSLKISSFADVAEAINIVQTELGITGTTAKEASATISGSLATMKAAWQNLLTGIGDENQDVSLLINNLVESIMTVADNAVPRIVKIIDGIGTVVTQIAPIIMTEVPNIINQFLPKLLTTATTLLRNVIDGIVTAAPTLLERITRFLPYLISVISHMLPDLIAAIIEIGTDLINSVADMFPDVAERIAELIPLLVIQLVSAVPEVLNAAITLLMSIVSAIPTIIPQLIQALPQIVMAVVNTLSTAIPTILSAANITFGAIVDALPFVSEAMRNAWPQITKMVLQMLTESIPEIITGVTALVKSVADAYPVILEAVSQAMPLIVNTIIDSMMTCYPLMLDAFTALLMALYEAIPVMIAGFYEHAPQIFLAIYKTITDRIPEMLQKCVEFFWQYINAIPQVADSLFSNVDDLVLGVIDSLKEAYADAWEVGKEFVKNLGEGIEIGWDWLKEKVSDLASALFEGVDFGSLSIDGSVSGSTSGVPQMAKGGVLERGQIGLLEGTGAEAVVPLENNRAWLSKVAEDLSGMMPVVPYSGSSDEVKELKESFQNYVDNLPDMLVEAFSSLRFDINNREFARLVKAVN